MVYIIQKIDWLLRNDNKVIIDLRNVTCTYKKDDYLLFNEDIITNEIHLKDKLYKRIAPDYTMEIDFNKLICKFTFPNNELCEFSMDGNFIVLDNEIRLKYSYDKEIKEIIITFKDDEI